MGVVKPREQLPFPPEVVGTYSCHGVEPGARAGQTAAKINQDRGCVCYPFGPKGDMALFCVYDGHGTPPPPIRLQPRPGPTARAVHTPR